MNIVDQICRKYKREYNLLGPKRIRSFRLNYGRSVPDSLQMNIEDSLMSLSVLPDPSGNLNLQVDRIPGKKELYSLSIDGKTAFYLEEQSDYIRLPDSVMAETIAWAVYIMATNEDRLKEFMGKGIVLSCGCFSARQQSAALRIRESVRKQYSMHIPEGLLDSTFQQLLKQLNPFLEERPRFSDQPLCKEACEGARGGQIQGTLDQIARRLYGGHSFEEEIQSYCQMVRGKNAYQESLEAGIAAVQNQISRVPVMAASSFFSNLRTKVDEMEYVSEQGIRSRLQKQVSFSLSIQNLHLYFAEVDLAYDSLVRYQLMSDFLKEVCDQGESVLQKKCRAGKQEIVRLNSALSQFCFVNEECFHVKNQTPMGWQELADLQDRDIFSEDVSWDQDSFFVLRNMVAQVQPPSFYVCSDRLNDACVAHMVEQVPLMDDRLIWAFWWRKATEEEYHAI